MQLSHLRSTIRWYIWVCHIFFLILFQPYALSLFLPVSLSLMMGVFLFCGGCELSEFVSVSIIPSLWAPAYKSDEGPRALSHRPPVSGLSLLLYAHTATGKTVDKHTEQNRNRKLIITEVKCWRKCDFSFVRCQQLSVNALGHIQEKAPEFRK